MSLCLAERSHRLQERESACMGVHNLKGSIHIQIIEWLTLHTQPSQAGAQIMTSNCELHVAAPSKFPFTL